MLIFLWMAVGAVIAMFVHVWTRRLLATDHKGWLTAPLTATLLTAVLFGSLAWRLGWTVELLPYSHLAAAGVSLSIVDTVEQRLPNKLVLTSLLVLGGFFGVLSIVNLDGASLVRAVVGSIVVAGFYLALALASGGGLGAGDVKLGGLLGLALGWLSWPALMFGVFLGWCSAGAAWLALRLADRSPQNRQLPAGPFLVFGTLVAIGVMPTS
ncbi:prepilin peptidase [Kibdelosporangium aridum]|uniref:Leader peptidase (Prepilin peptidase) / N-methyltransferase n=1 Tax=Kibdelosporangium aridum TaxID=2030 RepID=A0A1Y5YD73_KIBAR|nr:prepilin peptidase [Kibdelosporangium aridum]SMD27599.1 leader peptidase (prepilin peptidase) / N-methyltransferase [Kibdelosporangium aridum]